MSEKLQRAAIYTVVTVVAIAGLGEYLWRENVNNVYGTLYVESNSYIERQIEGGQRYNEILVTEDGLVGRINYGSWRTVEYYFYRPGDRKYRFTRGSKLERLAKEKFGMENK